MHCKNDYLACIRKERIEISGLLWSTYILFEDQDFKLLSTLLKGYTQYVDKLDLNLKLGKCLPQILLSILPLIWEKKLKRLCPLL